MFELDQRIAEQLTEVALNSAIQVRCGNSNAFMVTASTMVFTFLEAEVQWK